MPTNEERKQQLLRAGEEHRIAAAWMAEHIEDYVQSEPNAMVIGNYLDQKGLPFTHENLEKAFICNLDAGWDFTKANAPALRELLPARVSAAPVVAASPASTPVEPAPPVEDALPEIPNWFPKLETNADIRALSPEQFKKLYFGKAGEKFKARIQAIKQRGL